MWVRAQVLDIVDAQASYADHHEQFFKQLDGASNRFGVVADYFGKGVFNKITLISGAPPNDVSACTLAGLAVYACVCLLRCTVVCISRYVRCVYLFVFLLGSRCVCMFVYSVALLCLSLGVCAVCATLCFYLGLAVCACVCTPVRCCVHLSVCALRVPLCVSAWVYLCVHVCVCTPVRCCVYLSVCHTVSGMRHDMVDAAIGNAPSQSPLPTQARPGASLGSRGGIDDDIGDVQEVNLGLGKSI